MDYWNNLLTGHSYPIVMVPPNKLPKTSCKSCLLLIWKYNGLKLFIPESLLVTNRPNPAFKNALFFSLIIRQMSKQTWNQYSSIGRLLMKIHISNFIWQIWRCHARIPKFQAKGQCGLSRWLMYSWSHWTHLSTQWMHMNIHWQTGHFHGWFLSAGLKSLKSEIQTS